MHIKGSVPFLEHSFIAKRKKKAMHQQGTSKCRSIAKIYIYIYEKKTRIRRKKKEKEDDEGGEEEDSGGEREEEERGIESCRGGEKKTMERQYL